MTVLEAKYLYGTKEYQASEGDNLMSICRHLYQSDDDIYSYTITVLNEAMPWHSLKAGTVIEYLPKFACDLVYEITS